MAVQKACAWWYYENRLSFLLIWSSLKSIPPLWVLQYFSIIVYIIILLQYPYRKSIFHNSVLKFYPYVPIKSSGFISIFIFKILSINIYVFIHFSLSPFYHLLLFFDYTSAKVYPFLQPHYNHLYIAQFQIPILCCLFSHLSFQIIFHLIGHM